MGTAASAAAGWHVATLYRMSDRLWARVAAVLATVDPTPPSTTRALLDAIMYQAMTGTAWEVLPPTYPPVPEVRAASERWRALGLFAALTKELSLRLDE